MKPTAYLSPKRSPKRSTQFSPIPRNDAALYLAQCEDRGMNRQDALPYVAYAVDNALSERRLDEIPANAVLVGWQCGFEPMFVAVWSYTGDALDAAEAEDMAVDLLQEKKWFEDNCNPPPADYIIGDCRRKV